MGKIYPDVADRLKEERGRLGFSQQQMSCLLRMSQSHYSKVEQGKRRLSFYEVQCLCDSSIDIEYVFTGERKRERNTEKDSAIDEKLVPYAVCFLCLLLLHRFESARTNDEYKRISMMFRLYEGIVLQNKNIMSRIRSISGMTQKEFADLLLVDVKKVRSLEKGNVLPDSELIWRLYANLGVSPAIILNDYKGMINDLWKLYDMLTEEEKNSISSVLCYMKRRTNET